MIIIVSIDNKQYAIHRDTAGPMTSFQLRNNDSGGKIL